MHKTEVITDTNVYLSGTAWVACEGINLRYLISWFVRLKSVIPPIWINAKFPGLRHPGRSISIGNIFDSIFWKTNKWKMKQKSIFVTSFHVSKKLWSCISRQVKCLAIYQFEVGEGKLTIAVSYWRWCFES